MTTIEQVFENREFKVIQQELDLELKCGDSRLIAVRLRDKWTHDVIDLTSARLHFAVSGSLTSPFYDSPVLEKHSATHAPDLYVLDAVGGILVLRLRAVDTLGLMPRDYSYALSFVDAQGNGHAILTGKLKVGRSVGRLAGKLFYHKQKWNGASEGVDGTNFDFQLEAQPEPNSTLILFDGVVQTEGIDYIIEGKLLHFIGTPPDAGSMVEAIFPSIEP